MEDTRGVVRLGMPGKLIPYFVNLQLRLDGTWLLL